MSQNILDDQLIPENQVVFIKAQRVSPLKPPKGSQKNQIAKWTFAIISLMGYTSYCFWNQLYDMVSVGDAIAFFVILLVGLGLTSMWVSALLNVIRNMILSFIISKSKNKVLHHIYGNIYFDIPITYSLITISLLILEILLFAA
ncbi:MAG: hypothetical protein GY810_30270 [Aureispira sp.]|nr:hypothetical protein [Aureispira sp.]